MSNPKLTHTLCAGLPQKRGVDSGTAVRPWRPRQTLHPHTRSAQACCRSAAWTAAAQMRPWRPRQTLNPCTRSGAGLLQKRGVDSGSADETMEATLTGQLGTQQRDLARRLQRQAALAWWRPGHPGWAIWPVDTEHFMRSAQARPRAVHPSSGCLPMAQGQGTFWDLAHRLQWQASLAWQRPVPWAVSHFNSIILYAAHALFVPECAPGVLARGQGSLHACDASTSRQMLHCLSNGRASGAGWLCGNKHRLVYTAPEAVLTDTHNMPANLTVLLCVKISIGQGDRSWIQGSVIAILRQNCMRAAGGRVSVCGIGGGRSGADGVAVELVAVVPRLCGAGARSHGALGQ